MSISKIEYLQYQQTQPALRFRELAFVESTGGECCFNCRNYQPPLSPKHQICPAARDALFEGFPLDSYVCGAYSRG